MNTPENDPAVVIGGCDNDVDDELEEFSDEFKCCVCLDLIYKPVVLACGHISCFWCVFEAMDIWQESHCPVCRYSYNHFPSICWLLHSMLLKLYPKAYQKRESQVTEDEKTRGTFSPQFEKQMPLKCDQDCLDTESLESGTCTNSSDEITKKMSIEEKSSNGSNHVDKCHNDLLCGICKQLLYRPVVLNCGHVFCDTCIVNSCNEPCRCPLCQSMHPNGFPKVCLVLEGFLKQNVPEEYSARKVAVDNLRASETGSSSTAGAQSSSVLMNDYSEMKVQRVRVHYAVGCDCCGMYPLVGERYRCKDCFEDIGFDLCGNCYKSSSNLSGRFNQQHKPDHKFEVVEPRPIIILSPEFPEDSELDNREDQYEDQEGGLGPTNDTSGDQESIEPTC